jgi:hypothetical protein
MTIDSRLLAVAAALTLTVFLTACGDDDDSTFAKQTVRFTEQESKDFGFADNPPEAKLGPEGPEEFSTGDAVSFSGELLDDSGAAIGGIDITCTVTRPGRFDQSHQQCTATATLADGTLVLSRGGIVFGADSPEGAVIGGTGAYAGAIGEFTETEEAEGTTRYDLEIQIPES